MPKFQSLFSRRATFIGLIATLFSSLARAMGLRVDPDARPPVPRQPPTWIFFSTWLLTEEVVPRGSGPGGGSMSGTLTLATRVLEWRVTYARLSGPATLAGFFGPAAKGANGPLAVRLPDHAQSEARGSGHELTGRTELTQAQVDELVAGRWYVSVSTAAAPQGEVRGQIGIAKTGVGGV
jgi:hypothetical protein